ANRSKHQAIVKPLMSEDWTGDRPERHQLRFSSFTHGGRWFPEVEITAALAPAYGAASRAAVDTGNEVNAIFLAGHV
ncbi:MAG: hypothetical protein IIZ92_12635, partial [Aquincola sp.]|nr:hypothetical protein [Aquincola sp.]